MLLNSEGQLKRDQHKIPSGERPHSVANITDKGHRPRARWGKYEHVAPVFGETNIAGTHFIRWR